MQTIRCKIEQVTPFNDSIYKVVLTPQSQINFRAGQYLFIVMDEQDKRPFSIASAPNSKQIELHIGAAVAESYPMQVIERLKTNQFIDIQAPNGDAYLREQSQRPRLLIAGGTGFSYIKSIIEDQIERGQTVKTTFYWGCRNQEAMYDEAIARRWQLEHTWLDFIPVIEQAPAGWDGKEANLLAQLQQDFINFHGYDIYIAGRFEMVGVAQKLLCRLGVDTEHLYGDAFAASN